MNDRQKKRWNISSTETLESLLQKIDFLNAKDLINTLKIRCIAPASDIIAKDISQSEINKLSVGIVVEIERNDGLVKLLDVEEKSEFAVTSVYNKTIKKGRKEVNYKNPDKNTIKKYKNYINDIGATADVLNGEAGIGVLKVSYNLLEQEMNINTYGTAVEKII